jgi:dTDP-4-dehydrorhamnose reductase
MKILVTGADGQLGTDLCELLRTQSHEVVAPGLDELDFLKPDTIIQQVEHHQPDWVINCAAYTQVDQAEQDADVAFAINRDAAATLARTVKENAGRLLHISTDFIFDGNQQAPYKEEAEAKPLCVYGQSKWEGERAVLEIDPGVLVVRTAWVYGVHGANFVKTILRLAGERQELKIVADQLGTPSWTQDIASVLLTLMNQQAHGIYHYTNEGQASWYEFACAIVDEARSAGFKLVVEEVLPIPAEEYPTPAERPKYSVLDKSKISPLLDQPIPQWRTSLKKMLEELHACHDYS